MTFEMGPEADAAFGGGPAALLCVKERPYGSWAH